MSLSSDQIDAIVTSALSEIASASDLDALKEVRIEHVGDRSPIAKANQSLGQLEAAERAEFVKIVGKARATNKSAFEDRQKVL